MYTFFHFMPAGTVAVICLAVMTVVALVLMIRGIVKKKARKTRVTMIVVTIVLVVVTLISFLVLRSQVYRAQTDFLGKLDGVPDEDDNLERYEPGSDSNSP